MTRLTVLTLASGLVLACGGKVLENSQSATGGSSDQGQAGSSPTPNAAGGTAIGGTTTGSGGVGTEEPVPAPCDGFLGLGDCGWDTWAVANEITGCEFALSFEPEDVNAVNVAVDCYLIPQSRDDTEQWNVLPSSPRILRIEGEHCLDLRNGRVGRIDLVMGCPGPP